MKVLIFGAGKRGLAYASRKIGDNIKVVGFLDNDKKNHNDLILDKFPCYSPEKVCELDYDKIIITTASEKMRSDIFMQLMSLDVPVECVGFYPDTWDYPSKFPFFENFSRLVEEQNIEGNVAECGVDFGNSAHHLNMYFNKKKLYLFDTFEGFTRQDIEAERAQNNSAFLEGCFNFIGGWNHSIDEIMNLMSYPENITVKKGWVPESFEGIDDNFCFVNLDMCLYQPTIAALNFFWNKMSRGGVIVLCGYYHSDLPGIKKALDDFEVIINRRISKVPLYEFISMVLVKD
jgi:hypothetical protein